jgi:hypothetical protein
MVKQDDLVGPNDSDVETKVRDFSILLDQIDTLSDKKRQLWREIYENAVTDRLNSFAMFSELHKIVKGKPTEHAVHAKSMTSYLERMAKSNDQLIRLAELIADADKKSQAIDPNSMYEEINRLAADGT